MKVYKPLLCLVAASLCQLSYAKTDYDAYRLGHYSDSFKALNAISNRDPIADYYLGQLYLYGYGKLKNKALALQYFQKAANQNYLPAQMLMGQYELQVNKNPEDALKWFSKAAQKGELSAQMYVAGAYLYGYGAKKNPDLARRYYIDAAKSGNAIAQYTLAENFLSARATSSQRLGLIWLNKAAAAGNNPKAKTLLAEIYIKGRLVSPDLLTAQDLLEKAAAQEYAPAMLRLGDLALSQNEGQRAQAWYQKAAALDNQDAMNKLAQMYLDKTSRVFDVKKGFEMTLKLAQLGSVEAEKQVAQLYKTGVGTEVNLESAEQWEKKAQQPVTAKKEIPPQVLLAQWLTNDKSDRLNLPEYQPEGIYTQWTNATVLRDTIYNQPPKMEALTRNSLFKPRFVLSQPNSVSLSDYYDAMVKSESLSNDSQWTYPVYSLSKHLEAQLQANSSVLRQHEETLPYADAYTLPKNDDFALEDYFGWQDDWQKNSNYLAIFSEIYNRAILGDSMAQFHVGQMFQYGLGVIKNEQQAITFYEKAAAQQNMPAQYSMGVLYLKHQDDPELYLRGIQWLTDAAFKGNAYAQYVLANALRERADAPLGLQMDNGQALSMLYLSAANGYGLAEYELAERLSHQASTDFNIATRQKLRKEILKLYRDAEEQGVTRAQLPLAFYNAMDKNPKARQQAFDVAKVEAEAGKPKAALLLGLLYDRGIGVAADQGQAIYWYQKAEDNNVTQFILGTYISEGKGIYKDVEKGMGLLKQAAQNGFSYADLNLAILNQQSKRPFLTELTQAYEEGNSRAGVLLADYTLAKHDDPHSLDQALVIYKGLAERGDPFAQLKLGYMFEKGIGTGMNDVQANAWYLAAAQQGNAVAQYQLGQQYQRGYPAIPDYPEALAWYGKAQAELPAASVAIGFIQETVFNHYDAALKSYQAAASRGDVIGDYDLALMYQYGKGMPVDYVKAREHYIKAADKGVASAISQLAGLYFNGLGVNRDTQLALGYYQKAAQMGSDDAMYQLGIINETGITAEVNYPDALKYYKQAADKGNEKAMIALARMYQYGLGVKKDIQEAMGIYQKLADRNNPYGQYQLGTFYLEGTAGDRMPDKGRQWLENASRNGSVEAAKALKKLDIKPEARASIVEPANLSQVPPIDDQPAELVYFNALSEWNCGDERMAKMMFHQLMSKYPDYKPVKYVMEQLNQPNDVKVSLNKS